MYLLGFDIGSSSVKVSLIDAAEGQCIHTAFAPKQEMEMLAHKPGWAEQAPEQWWENLKLALREVMAVSGVSKDLIKAIGISYQMHGLVVVDAHRQVLRPAIIWCDSRAVEIGKKAFEEMGEEQCLRSLLNSPGNFTASKLRWVKENEPALYAKIDKILLPGDFIAMKLTGEVTTTNSGLSEGILWDFPANAPARQVLDYYEIDAALLPALVPVFSDQGKLTEQAAHELGLSTHTIVAYRAGDQPNNALSLNVLKPGEVAATAGTSGVIYGVTDKISYDPRSRVNSFVHVNHTAEAARLGVLLCINGTGILNSWIKNKLLAGGSIADYEAMNRLAAATPVGADGLSILPFGNGAERVLENRLVGAHFAGLDFNRHTQGHILRAAQEGIVYALNYGLNVMREVGVQPYKIKAGAANMFLSPVFGEAFASVTGAVVELYNTDGAQGAARGAGYGSGVYKSLEEAFAGLKAVRTIEPHPEKTAYYQSAYSQWHTQLQKLLASEVTTPDYVTI